MNPDQRRAMTVTLRAAQWLLADIAHDLPANRVTQDQWGELSAALDQLSSLVREQADSSGETR
jgi:hypothetical protein